MFYLAQFTLCRQDYPDNTTEEETTRLVKALNERDAEARLIEYYESQSDPYDVSYTVKNLIVHPTIS